MVRHYLYLLLIIRYISYEIERGKVRKDMCVCDCVCVSVCLCVYDTHPKHRELTFQNDQETHQTFFLSDIQHNLFLLLPILPTIYRQIFVR